MINPVSNKFLLSLNRQRGIARLSLIAYLLAGVSLIVIAWTMLPPGLSTKVSLIGQGKPVIAIIYNNNDSSSEDLKDNFKQLLNEYLETVEFVKINIRSPNGIRFNQHTPIKAGMALYFNGAGEQVHILYGPQDVATISESIKHNFDI